MPPQIGLPTGTGTAEDAVESLCYYRYCGALSSEYTMRFLLLAILHSLQPQSSSSYNVLFADKVQYIIVSLSSRVDR
eukprot:scaffold39553_cov167-Skeletonema_dohrnii-CCMP3373.AAC.2